MCVISIVAKKSSKLPLKAHEVPISPVRARPLINHHKKSVYLLQICYSFQPDVVAKEVD